MGGWNVVLGIAAACVVSGAKATEHEVTIDGGRAPLHGSLMVPLAAAAGPAVLIIAGSGPTDREGNSAIAGVKPATLRLLAEGLAARGIASLRFDKRGIAASGPAAPPEIDLRFTNYVDDAVAWAKFLASQSEVSCVVIAGHSEGALVAAMAAQRAPVCGLVEISGAGRPADVVITEQLAQFPEPLHSQALAALAEVKAGRPVVDPPFPALLRPSVQPYLTSWLAIDPAAELSKVKAPILIIQGDRDLQVSLEDAKRLAAARPGATLMILPGVNHVLKDAPADRAGNIATYADSALPLHSKVVPAIADFVKEAAAARPASAKPTRASEANRRTGQRGLLSERSQAR